VFIVLEGLSGCGKSSAAASLVSSGWIGVSPPHEDFRVARRRVDDDQNALEARHALFLSGVLDSATQVSEAVNSGANVVADSWLYRTEATHAVLGSRLQIPRLDFLPNPDFVFFLDCPESMRQERRSRRGTPDPYWKSECERRSGEIRRYYLTHFPELKMIDAAQEISVVVSEIRMVLGAN